ncbi:MAG: uncharacterized protein KVP18_001218 [Porospora cf. gigantea A]|uniref:uncharacterized protein n=1 Tax=Porospora cf. gigantea A TaxID=2853593 RepID=UPI003559A6B5|nr:MAG: hypothetical protein KVP18_001218 [Porospora cf. gigantea A]
MHCGAIPAPFRERSQFNALLQQAADSSLAIVKNGWKSEDVRDVNESISGCLDLLKPYREAPQLLDGDASSMVELGMRCLLDALQDDICNGEISMQVLMVEWARFLYGLGSVRKHARLSLLLPRDPASLPLVAKLLQATAEARRRRRQALCTDNPLWTMSTAELQLYVAEGLWRVHVFLMWWLYHLLLLPFPLASLLPSESMEGLLELMASDHLAIVRSTSAHLFRRYFMRSDSLVNDWLAATARILAAQSPSVFDDEAKCRLECLSETLKLHLSPTECILANLAALLMRDYGKSPYSSRKLRSACLSRTTCLRLTGNAGSLADPTALEAALTVLLEDLRDPVLVVRWSAAKGIARVVRCLDRPTGRKVADFVFSRVEFIPTTKSTYVGLHGELLCLSLLCKIGLLDEYVDRLLVVVGEALLNDVDPASQCVRDGALCLLWSLSRYCPRSVVDCHYDFCLHLTLKAALLSVELCTRRGGAAALQALVGCRGTSDETMIDLLQLVNFTSVGPRSQTFRSLTPLVAGMIPTAPLLDFVVRDRVLHPVAAVREDSGRLLAKLLSLGRPAEEVVVRVLRQYCALFWCDPSPFRRHGCLVGIRATVSVLDGIVGHLDAEAQADVLAISRRMEKERGFRGRGGQELRAANLEVMAAVCASKAFCMQHEADTVVQAVQEGLLHPYAPVQQAASSCLQAILKRLHRIPPPVMDFLTRALPKFRTMVQGQLLGICQLPFQLLTMQDSRTVRDLCFRIIGDSSADVECRLTAGVALALQWSFGAVGCLDDQEISQLIHRLSFDFATDTRGDVGSWLREFAAEIIVLHLSRDSSRNPVYLPVLVRLATDNLHRVACRGALCLLDALCVLGGARPHLDIEGVVGLNLRGEVPESEGRLDLWEGRICKALQSEFLKTRPQLIRMLTELREDILSEIADQHSALMLDSLVRFEEDQTDVKAICKRPL